MDNTDLSNNFFDNTEIVTETQPITEPVIVTETQPITELVIVTEIQSITQPVIVIETQTQSQPVIVTETQPITEPVIVTETQPITEPVIVTETQPITQPVIVTETQPITEPVIVIETQPITEPVIVTEPDIITLNNIISETDAVTQLQLQPQQLLQLGTDLSNNIIANTNTNLKNSINVFDQNVKNIYRPKNSWGPVIWNFIHTISIIDFLENEMYVNEVKKYLQSVFNILPCKHCCETYKIWIDKLDTIDINERMVLFKWSVDLHNEVNQKLNKQTLTYEQAVEIWCNKLPELPLL